MTDETEQARKPAVVETKREFARVADLDFTDPRIVLELVRKLQQLDVQCLRQQTGVTQEQASEASNVKLSTLRQWEQHLSHPRLHNLQQFLEGLIAVQEAKSRPPEQHPPSFLQRAP
jgi:hypothetical protein